MIKGIRIRSNKEATVYFSHREPLKLYDSQGLVITLLADYLRPVGANLEPSARDHAQRHLRSLEDTVWNMRDYLNSAKIGSI